MRLTSENHDIRKGLLLDKHLRGFKEHEYIWNAWKAQGYTLSPMGRIYDSRTDGLYPRIEKKLLAQRNEFRNYEDDIFLNIIETLEKRKKEILDNQK